MNTRLSPQSRRTFLGRASWAAVGATLSGPAFTAAQAATRSSRAARISPNDKLNIAMIGTANQAAYNLNNVASQNIVALCDVDDRLLAAAAQKFPSARTYTDFRKVFDQRDIDAVVVATPDHTHAMATSMALRSGHHVYCEKPLTRTVSECRTIRDLARRLKRVTQMGTQIHAGDNYRRVVELVQGGALGAVNEVHVWVGGGFGNKERPSEKPPVPAHLHYDEWLGPVPHVPYSPDYVPFNWRHYWDFGGGTLADLGCHHMDLAHWALKIRTPETVEVLEGPAPHPVSAPHYLIVRYTYPGKNRKQPIVLTWYHGGKRPPHFKEHNLPKWGDGTLFVGENGRMLLSGYDKHALLPEASFKDYQRPAPSIPKSKGHHLEWIEACKNGGPTTCNFDYSGALTEAVLLGNVAFRTGKKLVWNEKKMLAVGCPEADAYLNHVYRDGWKL